MKKTRCKLDQLSEVTRRNNDRDIEYSERLFQLRHLPERYEQLKRMIPKPGKEAQYDAIMARYINDLNA